jgi:signal transduction histidine kinase
MNAAPNSEHSINAIKEGLVRRLPLATSPANRQSRHAMRPIGASAAGDTRTFRPPGAPLGARLLVYGLALWAQVLAELRRARRAERAAQRLLQSLLDAQTAEIAILDANGRILASNRAWRQADAGFSARRPRGKDGVNYLEACACGQPWERKIAAGLRRMLAGAGADYRLDYRRDSLAGANMRLRITRMGAGRETRLIVAHEDITHLMEAEHALKHLSARLMQSQDEERRRIARELHDSTAQNLLGATLLIGQALRAAPGLPSAVRRILEEGRALIDQSQCEMRTLSYLLHPPLLDEAGLPAALRFFVSRFAARCNIDAEIHVAPDVGRMPADIEAALFRVAQEALTNVHRHSGSRTVRVRLWQTEASSGAAHSVLAVEDDGIGLPPYILKTAGYGSFPCLAPDHGLGLCSMRERLHRLGGWLEISSSRLGTTIVARVPLSAASAPRGDRGAQQRLQHGSDPRHASPSGAPAAPRDHTGETPVRA